MKEYKKPSQCRNEKCCYHDTYFTENACRKYDLIKIKEGACPDYAPAKEFEDLFINDDKPSTLDMSAAIRQACDEMAEFLISKNESYGNSIADPIKIFSQTDPLEQINVRLDDKLSRIIRGKSYPGDNDLKDLSGYHLLKRAVEIHQGE